MQKRCTPSYGLPSHVLPNIDVPNSGTSKLSSPKPVVLNLSPPKSGVHLWNFDPQPPYILISAETDARLVHGMLKNGTPNR